MSSARGSESLKHMEPWSGKEGTNRPRTDWQVSAQTGPQRGSSRMGELPGWPATRMQSRRAGGTDKAFRKR